MRADEVPRGRGPPKHATDTSAREGFGLGLAARAASGLEGRQTTRTAAASKKQPPKGRPFGPPGRKRGFRGPRPSVLASLLSAKGDQRSLKAYSKQPKPQATWCRCCMLASCGYVAQHAFVAGPLSVAEHPKLPKLMPPAPLGPRGVLISTETTATS